MRYGEGVEFHTSDDEVIRVVKQRQGRVEVVLVTKDISVLLTMGSEVARQLGSTLIEAGQ